MSIESNAVMHWFSFRLHSVIETVCAIILTNLGQLCIFNTLLVTMPPAASLCFKMESQGNCALSLDLTDTVTYELDLKEGFNSQASCPRLVHNKIVRVF